MKIDKIKNDLLKKIKIPQQEKIIILIGDDGAVLAYFVGKKLVSRLFSPSPAPVDTKEFIDLLAKHPKAKIHVILDNMEQNYNKQILPAISSLSIGKLVNKRLERDFVETDIKGAYLLGRAETGRKDWIYMFVSLPMNETLEAWLDFLSSLPNSFCGIAMLPAEMVSFIGRINSSIFNDGVKKKCDWQILVIHNKTGGFRQIVFHKDQVVFTRLVRNGKETVPDIIAGNVEQEILNTIDYLRRLNFTDYDPIDIIIVVANEIKKGLSEVRFRNKKFFVYSPFELCNLVKLHNISSDSDKFADLLVAANYINSKTKLKLFTKKTKQIYNLNLSYQGLNIALIVMMMLLVPYSMLKLIDLFTIKIEISKLNKDKVIIENKWKEAEVTYKYNMNDADKILDAVRNYKILASKVNDPILIIDKVAKAKNNYANISSLAINYSLASNTNHNNTPTNSSSSANSSFNKDEKWVISSLVNFKFYNMGKNVEELFKNYDAFVSLLNKNFAEYSVNYSKLPDKISFGTLNNKLDIQLTIKNKQEVN